MKYKDRAIWAVKKFFPDAIGAFYSGQWHGFEVWEPDFGNDILGFTFIGFPQFILINDELARTTNSDEAMDIMDDLMKNQDSDDLEAPTITFQ